MQMKNTICKYFQKNLNMQQKRKRVNFINEELNLDESDDDHDDDDDDEENNKNQDCVLIAF